MQLRPRSLRRPATATGYAAVSAVAVLLAVTAQVDTVRKAELNDGGVWVTNGTDRAFGRYIKAIGQLDAAIFPKAASSTDLDILQEGSAVLAWDRSSATLFGVDTATRQLAGDGVVLPPGAQVAFGGGTLASLDDKGELRIGRVGLGTPDAASVGAQAPPSRKGFDKGSALAVGPDGSVAVATPKAVTVVPQQGEARTVTVPPAPRGHQVAFVGGRVVVFDPASGRVDILDNGAARSADTGLGADARLQQSGPASDTVAVAGRTGLVLVSLADAAITRVSDAGNGSPAAPVRVGSCVFSAWQDGAYARSCGGTKAPQAQGFTASTSVPVFRVNRGLVVLNDSATGAVYDVDDKVRAAQDIWKRVQQNPNAPVERVKDQPRKHQGDNKPPDARADVVGARVGRPTVLHVLDNDSDPEGDLLTIVSTTAPSVAGTSVVVAPDGQSLVVTLPSGVVGNVTFGYTVSDGYGGTATAQVTVVPRPTGENKPPALRPGFSWPSLAVAPGGTLRVPVLDNWRDFDGDPMLVTDAAPAGSVVATADGSLLVTAPMKPGPLPVTYAVSDGIAAPVADGFTVQVLDPNSPQPFAPPIARPDAVRVVVGQPAAVLPLRNDLPGADATDPQAHLTLASPVAPVDGLTVATDLARGVVTVTASREGTFHLAYNAAFGAAPTAPGEIRVDAVAAQGQPQAPIAMPDAAVLRGQKPASIDVLANDVDPSGGILVVQDVTADPAAGVAATVVDGRMLRLVATGSNAGTTSGTVTYRVSNGRTPPVEGTVAVTLLPAATTTLSPFAATDSVVVRAGDTAAVPVLDNDFDPNGDDLSLVPLPVPVDPPTDGVVASVSGKLIRIAVAATITSPKQVTLQYVVTNTSGARATGRVSVSIQPPGQATQDQPPAPRDVEGRLVAGDTFVVHVPVYGVDPDGDSVTVTSVVRPPALGRVIGVGPDSITYQAYPTSGGTDSFTYQVVDPQGRSGQATVRLGIVQPGSLAPAVAVDDLVSGVPGRSIHLDVTVNDVVPAGARATVLPLSKLGPVPAGVTQDGNVLTVRVPDVKAAPVVVPYAVTDGSGTPSTANLVVRGDDTAKIPPVAQDDTPPPGADLSAPITVDVLKNDDDPDGSRADLKVTVFEPDVKVSGGSLVIPVRDVPRQVPYVVTDPDGLTAMAVVRVPGKDSSLPRVKPGARIAVGIGQTAQVPLSDVVEAPGGTVRLTTTDTFFASPSGGVSLAANDEKTLSVAAGGQYAGPGAVSFQVSDKPTLQDPAAHTVQLTVPVQVGPDAPALRCPTTPVAVVQGGQDTTADLLSLCHVWVDTTVKAAPVRIDAAFGQPLDGVTPRMDNGTVLALTAAGSAKPGANGTLKLTVPGTPVTADLPVTVVAAPKATVRAVTLNGLLAERTTTVDLTQYVTSPLRDPKPAVTNVRQTGGKPVAVTQNGMSVTVTPGRDTNGSVTIQATVNDEPSQPDRAVPVILSGTVASRPDQPGQPSVVAIGSRQLTIAFSPPADNGSPIQRFEVGGGPGGAICQASPCIVTGLTNGTPYALTVTAVNAIGTSDPSAPAPSTAPDEVPGVVSAIRLVPGDGTIAASWDAAPNQGSPLDDYQVEIQPGGGGLVSTRGGTSYTFSGLQNATPYQVRVRAHNTSQTGWGPWSASATQVPFGTPPTMPAPAAKSADVPNPAKERAITVSWSPAQGNGRDIATYTVAQYSDSSASGGFGTKVGEVSGPPSAFGGAGGYSKSYTVANDGKFYKFTVTATNAGDQSTNVPGKTSPPSPMSNAVQGAAPPDKMATPVAKDSPGGQAGYDGAIHVVYTTPASNAQTLTKVNYKVSNGATGSWPASASGQQAEQAIGVPNGTTVTVQLQACNDAGMCGPFSAPSNAVTPYGPPAPPNVNASQNGNVVSFSWGGGGGNGRPVREYNVCITGGPCQGGMGPGSFSKDYGYSASWRIDVFVVDTAGQRSGTASRTGTTPPAPPPPTVQVSWGGRAPASTCGGDTSCTYLVVTWSNFGAGQRRIQAYDNGVAWPTPTQSGSGGSGTKTNYWGAGWCNQPHTITAAVDGVQSNAILTTSHPC